MKYLFDTNIFIASKNLLPSDVWPTFWQRIAELTRDRKIYSSIKVKEEIEKGKDELTIWMKNNSSDDFYIELDQDIMQKYIATQNWATNSKKFKPTALQTFADVADAYIVATASAKGMTLVTYEKSNPMSTKRVMIPDVCQALNVQYCDLNKALRELGVTI